MSNSGFVIKSHRTRFDNVNEVCTKIKVSCQRMAYHMMDKGSGVSDTGDGLYFRMDMGSTCEPFPPQKQKYLRTWTIESELSGISIPSGEDDNGSVKEEPSPPETENIDIPRPCPDHSREVFHCSIPGTSHSMVYTMSAPNTPSDTTRENMGYVLASTRFPDPIVGLNNSNNVPQEGSMRACASSSCLESRSGGRTSTVSMSIPRLLRNSFSKLIQRANAPGLSRSPTDNSPEMSKHTTEKSSDLMADNYQRNTSQHNIMIASVEEIVDDSVRKGLPIIPFDYPTFLGTDKKVEETKKNLRKNSLKDLKKAFGEHKVKNNDIYNEEEENMCNNMPSISLSNGNADTNVPAKLNLETLNIPDYRIPSRQSEKRSKVDTSKSPYMEMSLSKDEARKSRYDRAISLCEDPYMRMDDLTEEKELHSKEEKYRSCYDPQFPFEKSPVGLERNYNSGLVNTFPRRKLNIFRRRSEETDTENNQVLQQTFGRKFKKGNKHKDDYVFVDFEKNNYYDMAKAGNNKWKFLNFSSSNSKN